MPVPLAFKGVPELSASVLQGVLNCKEALSALGDSVCVMQALFRPQPQCCRCEFCCSILSSVEAMMPTPVG